MRAKKGQDRRIAYSIRIDPNIDKLVLACMEKYNLTKTEAVNKMLLQGGIDLIV